MYIRFLCFEHCSKVKQQKLLYNYIINAWNIVLFTKPVLPSKSSFVYCIKVTVGKYVAGLLRNNNCTNFAQNLLNRLECSNQTRLHCQITTFNILQKSPKSFVDCRLYFCWKKILNEITKISFMTKNPRHVYKNLSWQKAKIGTKRFSDICAKRHLRERHLRKVTGRGKALS
jgi:hypothetical protein